MFIRKFCLPCIDNTSCSVFLLIWIFSKENTCQRRGSWPTLLSWATIESYLYKTINFLRLFNKSSLEHSVQVSWETFWVLDKENLELCVWYEYKSIHTYTLHCLNIEPMLFCIKDCLSIVFFLTYVILYKRLLVLCFALFKALTSILSRSKKKNNINRGQVCVLIHVLLII